jgi:very-short-patch-repair endonuclease
MSRRPRIPTELTKRPFSLDEARIAGLTKSSLRGRAWRRLGARLYCWNGLAQDPWQVLSAWRDSLPAEAFFAGPTAAWILGLDFNPIEPVEIVVPRSSGVRSRPGLSVRHCNIPPSEGITVRGLHTTTLCRTLRDLCLRWHAVEVLAAMDMALAKGLKLDRCAGTQKLRSLAAMAAPAESPMETRLRWLLIQRGLPRPEVQVNLRDSKNRFVGRADLYYPSARLVIEYDGGNHRDRLVEDDRRQNLLVNAGFRLLRFTAADIHNAPAVVQAQLRSALSQDSAASRSTSLTIPSRIFRPESQKPGSVISIPIRLTSSSGRVEPPAARNSRYSSTKLGPRSR